MVNEVVIVGGGFGGVRVAKILARLDEHIHITLIDKNRYHTFYPNLYEIATAYLPEAFGHLPANFFALKSSAIYPLDEIFLDDLNVTFLEDEALDIDFKRREIKLKNSAPHNYDILVIAAGSETNYFSVEGLSEYALPLKTFFDALSVRNSIDEAFIRIPKNHKIKILIGGGGFTGCEFAGELIGYIKKLSEIHGRPKNTTECIIAEASNVLMSSASAWVQKKAKKRLERLGVKFIFGNPIEKVESREIAFKNGSRVAYDVLIWTAGVRAESIAQALSGVKLERAFCLMVDEYLKILPYENVFGLGDITYCIDKTTGKALPMTAMVALREAKYVAENIKRSIFKKPLSKYKPHHTGFIIPLGGKYALLESHGIKISGILPWILKHFVALHYWIGILGWKKALVIWRKSLEIYCEND